MAVQGGQRDHCPADQLKGRDGRQYIAVICGVGGWSGAIVSGQMDPRDPTGALGFANAMKDLPMKSTTGGMLYVFAVKR